MTKLCCFDNLGSQFFHILNAVVMISTSVEKIYTRLNSRSVGFMIILRKTSKTPAVLFSAHTQTH